MKKIFTLFAAAFMAVGANAQTEELYVSSGNPGWYQATVKNVPLTDLHIDFREKWTVYQLIDKTNAITPTEYKGVKIQYEIDPTSTIAINLNVADKQYSGLDASKTEDIILFEDKVKALESIENVCLQQANEGKASIDVKAIYLVKQDDTEIQLTNSGENCYNNTVYKSCELKFAGWGSQGPLRNEEGKDLAYDPASNLAITYTIEFSEPISMGVALALNWKDKGDAKEPYTNLGAVEAGATSLTAIVSPETCDKIIASTAIQGRGDQSVKIKSIKRTIVDPTGVEKVEVMAADNGEFVNAAGQKVGKNYKGLVINKATGKKFINR